MGDSVNDNTLQELDSTLDFNPNFASTQKATETQGESEKPEATDATLLRAAEEAEEGAGRTRTTRKTSESLDYNALQKGKGKILKSKKDEEKIIAEQEKTIKKLEKQLETAKTSIDLKADEIKKLKKENKDLKNTLNAKDNQIDQLKKQKQSQNPTDEIKDLKAEIKDLKDANKDLEEENNDYKEEIEDMKEFRKEQITEIKNCNDKIEDLEEQVQNLQEQQANSTDQSEEISRLTEKTLDQKDEIEYLLNKLVEQSSPQSRGERKNEKKAEKIRNKLWANSNGKRMHPLLCTIDEETEWDYPENLYRLNDLSDHLKKQTDWKEYQNHLIMMGLNEIRDGEAASQILRKFKTALKPIQEEHKNIGIVEVPPVSNTAHKTEARYLNRLLKNWTDTEENLTMIFTWDEMEKKKYKTDEIFDKSGFHYKTDGKPIQDIALIIIEKAKQMEELKTELVPIPEGSSAYFIGKGGENFKKIAREQDVKIFYHDSLKKVKIQGKKNQVEEAKRMLDDLTAKYHSSMSIKPQQRPDGNKSQRECKFFKLGNCKYGDACAYKHVKEPRKPRSRSRSPIFNTYRSNRLGGGRRDQHRH